MRFLRVDDLMTSYTNPRPFTRLGTDTSVLGRTHPSSSGTIFGAAWTMVSVPARPVVDLDLGAASGLLASRCRTSPI